eukprot:357305-Chlamydomonas_euryale.AAC.3
MAQALGRRTARAQCTPPAPHRPLPSPAAGRLRHCPPTPTQSRGLSHDASARAPRAPGYGTRSYIGPKTTPSCRLPYAQRT